MFKFQNQRIIITGGTRGIGRGLSEAFLEAGGEVIATYTSNDEAAEKFKWEMENKFPKSPMAIRKFDVSRNDEVESFFSWIDENYSSIEVLINNSGIRKDNVGALMSEEDWKRVLEINLDGTFYMSKQAILRFMRKRYGRIINLSSVGGKIGLPGQANYTASKAAQIALAKSLSKEVAKKGITINSICPGFIETELISDLPEDQISAYKKQVPLKRFGTVDEVAHGVLFLASREASYITGTSLDISGGL
ncbi:MAG: 3-oxoacyl-ACP reductase FabG [Bdellovibrionota bacterium]|nr:3-oxoacyl-ACP reductase FabG [Bdellovibrionota bacterium]MEC8623235.1 3-oxoacyl-ACP reductase FabG [Bdellovibrionota bacterium]